MKKIKLILAGLLAFVCIATKVQAQTAPGFYAGKWDVLIKGTPNGDVHIIFNLTEKDGKLDGTFVDPESKKDVPLTKVETADGKATLYFTISTYDVNLAMEKVDDTHIKGSLMGMFESTGERIKE
nr:hypothetical protein [uncultured Mucilaginibacter sp.]